MNFDFAVYSAAGNIIGIAYYPHIADIQPFVNAPNARRQLKQTALEHRCDSVMVLVKNANTAALFKTIVFEPNNPHELGTFSTMCGNGIRAVAAYADEHLKVKTWPLLVATQSGVLEIAKRPNRTYRVLMGGVISKKDALRSYVNPLYFSENAELVDVPIPQSLLTALSGLPFANGHAVSSFGFTSNQDAARANGEPHMTIMIDSASFPTIEELRALAGQYGQALCNNRDVFPLGINVNFMAAHPDQPNAFLICTFERNLGDDPKKCVTQACGTGSTFAAAQYMRESGHAKVAAHCLGGTLTIEKRDNVFYMSGDAVQIQKETPISNAAAPLFAPTPTNA